jgi:heat shock protein HslJ
MYQRRETPDRQEKGHGMKGMAVRLILAAVIILMAGCASWWGAKEEKKVPCPTVPSAIAGVYGAVLQGTETPGRMVRLKLFPDYRSEMITDPPGNKPAVIETGQWDCRSGSKVKVTLKGRKDLAYEKPVVLVFSMDADGLTAVTYDRGAWGETPPRLTRNPAVTGRVWRLSQIQYADNTALVPEEPSKYTLVLSQDGTVTVRADCNRGMGRFTMAGTYLNMEKFIYTRMICPENSLFDQYTKALEAAASCRITNGELFITLRKNGGTMKFDPAKAGD